MLDLDKYHTSKKVPVQNRSKETVRRILLATAMLSARLGTATITTNDIAEQADIPIGSVYGYFDDKNSIVASLLELYTTDIIKISDNLANNPLLPHMSHFEIITIILNAWSYYLTCNHPLSYIFFARSEPPLHEAVVIQRGRMLNSFCSFLHAARPHYPHDITPGSPCQLIMHQAISIVENAEILYQDNPTKKQQYIDLSVPAFCRFITSFNKN